MGQSLSLPSLKPPCTTVSSGRRSKPFAAGDPKGAAFAPDERRDLTADLPDECLAIVFQSLSAGDRKQCSVVCRRWLAVDGQSRHRLALEARAPLADVAPSIFRRFDSVTKLALKCDRRSDSIGDEALALIAASCPNLTRLKLRACRAITDAGMAAVAKHCGGLRKLSVGSCTFGAKGVDAVLSGCPLLEELSIKRLRGLSDGISVGESTPVVVVSSSLRSVCLKELYNGQCFAPLIVGSPNLKTLKLFRCSGDWDRLLLDIAEHVPGIVEVHLEKLQVSDVGLSALSSCVSLEILHLVKTPECTDNGLIAVAERCLLLRKIHIDGWKTNRIGDEGLLAIARKCQKLQELVLIGVNPTVRSLGLIASNCSNLERLALCSSETFGDAEIACIASKCIALKKLCVKGCPVSDLGMQALAEGCPNLVKVKVKCRGVTTECVDWLMASREGMLAVKLDSVSSIEQPKASVDESGVLENAGEPPHLSYQLGQADLSMSNNARSIPSNTRFGIFGGRNVIASAFRRWSNGSANPNPT